MAKEENSTQGQKPKVSKLAVASFVVPVLLWLGGWLFISIGLIPSNIPIFTSWFYNLYVFCSLPMILSSPPVGIALAISSLILISKSNGKIAGKRFAIEGIIISIILFVSNWLLGLGFFLIDKKR